ncbi:Uma2 family endonuclease [Winogradskya humida]|uniref:Uma2 family endonuclease n=1 Tax=Winogradskya humida TaxID=113566 RepID=UPI001EF30E23|nr:Uma2 family endonuclease [Actinoplanes humidus]
MTERMRPPRPEGWHADDLDHLPDAPSHIELIDGTLVFRTSPQRLWHARIVTALERALTKQSPPGIEAAREITIRLDKRNRLEPDVLATTAPYDPDRTLLTPDQVLLVVEVVSPESAHRDRTVKLVKYAGAGIAHYWRVEEEDGLPVVHAYELDGPTRSYAPTEIHRHELRSSKPIPDQDQLGRPGSSLFELNQTEQPWSRLQRDDPSPLSAQLGHVVNVGCQDHHRAWQPQCQFRNHGVDGVLVPVQSRGHQETGAAAGTFLRHWLYLDPGQEPGQPWDIHAIMRNFDNRGGRYGEIGSVTLGLLEKPHNPAILADP